MSIELPHRLPVRVYYEDTDAGGIVFYANYLKFAERGRTEFLRALGLDHPGLASRFGAGFAVRRSVADYLKPARLDDLVTVETRIAKFGGASIDMDQVILRGQDVLCRLEIRLALIDGKGRPMRLPEELRRGFAGLMPAMEPRLGTE